jgi:hypothetical protein
VPRERADAMHAFDQALDQRAADVACAACTKTVRAMRNLPRRIIDAGLPENDGRHLTHVDPVTTLAALSMSTICAMCIEEPTARLAVLIDPKELI